MRKTFTDTLLLKLTVFIVILICIGAVLGASQAWKLQRVKNEQKLLFVASNVQGQVSNCFLEISNIKGNKKLTERQKILRLNQLLQKRVERISSQYPDLGIGYYDIELDTIVSQAPHFDLKMLTPVPRSYPYFKSYETSKPEFVISNTSIAWKGQAIIAVTVPVVWEDKIIGHTWANIKTYDLLIFSLKNVTFILLSGLSIWCIIFYFWRRSIKKTLNLITQFSQNIIEENPNEIVVSKIPELGPVLEKLKHYYQSLKEASELCLRSEAHLRAIFDNSKIGIATATQEGLLFTYNNTFLSMLGYSREEVCKLRWHDLTYPDDVNQEKELVAQILSGKIDSYEIEKRFIHKDGSIIWTSLTVAALERNSENFIGFIQDITERKLHQEQLIKFDRLNLIGEMAAGISHEVRNPMTTVRGFLQMLKMKDECVKYNDYFDLMIEELDRANRIITEFLSIGKNASDNLSSENLNSIIEALQPLLEASAYEQNKYLSIELSDEIQDLQLNNKEIRQVLLNLCRNGLDAMEPGGKLTLKTSSNEEEVILEIWDEGHGIPSDIVEKIGTPFFTTKDSGTGLGLGICYSIAARHNATMSFRTSPSGTIFYLKFKPLSRGLTGSE